MTPELKKLLLDNAAAQVAYANQEEREYEYSYNGMGWAPTKNVTSYCWHRIKPTPKLRPFTLEEAFRCRDSWVRAKQDSHRVGRITEMSDNGISTSYGYWSYSSALENLELLNNVTGEWGPCGVEVEE